MRLMPALFVVALVMGREASAQHTFGIDVIVTEEARGKTSVYRYRVINNGSAPGASFTLGWDMDEGDAFLETKPTAIRSPPGWASAIRGAEGMSGFLIDWSLIVQGDAAHAIPAHGELTGFEVDLPRPDPLYRTTRATGGFFDGNHDVTSVTPAIASTDMTKPSVTVAGPAPGSNLAGTVTVAVNASDDVGILDVRFRVDERGIDQDTHSNGEPHSYSTAWDTLAVPNGTYLLTARARDAAGNMTVSAPVSVTVSNDLTPPTISLTSPLPGAVLSGTVTLTVSVQAVHQVMGVMYLIDNVHLGGTATGPYSQSWSTTTLANGSHEVRALVFDKSGRYGKATINVTVSN